MSWLAGWYIPVVLPCKVVYAVNGAEWNMDVVVVVGSQDLFLSALVEIGAMLLNIECKDLCTHVWWRLCDFWVMSVWVDVFNVVVHSVG